MNATLLKPVNVQRGGSSSAFITSDPAWTRGLIDKVVVKYQEHYFCRPLWNFGRRTPTARREKRAIQALRALGVSVPVLVDYWEDGENACLVTGFVEDALDLNEAIAQHPLSATTLLKATAVQIARMHNGGWVHGALYPVHILARRQSETDDWNIVLIDLEKTHRSHLASADIDRFLRYLSVPDPAYAHYFLDVYSAERN